MILVTGASGYVGSAAVRRLSTLGHSVAAMVRSASKAEHNLPAGVPLRIADYNDGSSLRRAFEGVARLLFVASDGDARDVVRHHANVIGAAVSAGVEHVTFTSIIDIDESSPFYFAPAYRDAERRLAGCGLERTILRCGLYSDLVLAHWLRSARFSGEISLPVGLARIAPVSRDDVAEAAAAAVVSLDRSSQVYALTGPRSYSFDEIAAAASEAFSAPIRYAPCSLTDYLRQAGTQMDAPWPHVFSTLCASISQQRYSDVSTDVERLLGKPAESFEDFLRRTATDADAVDDSGVAARS